MRLIDLHCDTIWRIDQSHQIQGLYQNNLHVDIQKLKQSDSQAQFFALFEDWHHLIKKDKKPWETFLERYDIFIRQLEINQEHIAFATSAADLDKNTSDGKISAFLTIEGAELLEGQISRLQKVHEMGVRLITLTWNYINSLGFPNGLSESDYPDQRLTPFGEEVVDFMNRNGMIIDVSHLSDQGFYHVHEISTKPYIASHSNARALRDHPRNLTDDMLKTIGEDGGIVGLNFFAYFLNDQSVSTVQSMLDHIRYIENKAGIDAVAIGTDFDGIEGYLEIENIGQMDKLLIGLQKAGYGDDAIEKIWSKNARRIIDEVIG